MVLELVLLFILEKQVINEVIVQLEVIELNKIDDGDFKEVLLVENRSDVEFVYLLFVWNGIDGFVNFVFCNDKVVSSFELGMMVSFLDVVDVQMNVRGMDLFLKLVSEKIDCLDSVDLSVLEFLQIK